MRPVGQGRPGTDVIPTGWQTSHAPVAAKAMTATVALRRPGGTTGWDEDVEDTVTVPHDPYAAGIAARVQALAQAGGRDDVEAAEQVVHVTSYLITIPFDTVAAPAPEDLVEVTTSADPLLVARTFRVVDVVRGSLRFERDLFCTLTDQ